MQRLKFFQSSFFNRNFNRQFSGVNFGIWNVTAKHPACKSLLKSRNMAILSCKNQIKWSRPKSFREKTLCQICNLNQNFHQRSRNASNFPQNKSPAQTMEQKMKNKTSLYYSIGFVIFVSGFSYASVLLYRLYCQVTGKGGRAILEDAGEKVVKMLPNKERVITVQFNADTNSTMMWNFKPSQPFINVSPGETALAFYTACNPTDKPITGVATYNILPYDAGKYFNKIQCFCFEEQQLNPHEEVDMPVFFYLDPEYAEDPRLEIIDLLVLSYTFFEAKEGFQLPFPTFR